MSPLLSELGLEPVNPGAWSAQDGWLLDPAAPLIESLNPASGELIASVRAATPSQYEQVMVSARAVAEAWRRVPAPKRGEAVRLVGDELRRHKAALGSLVTLEMGKIKAEGDGEVQEMIDIADFAVGQSRMLYGLSMHSERPSHRMLEQWHPLGVVGVISAFNFPVAVWAWNAFLAAICGNVTVWKPSPKTALCAIAVQRLCNRVLERHGYPGIFQLFVDAGQELATRFVEDRRVDLVSFTGSTQVGRRSRSGWRAGSARACSSSAATTPSSWTSPPISTSPCRRSCSARSEPPASAAPARAASSCTAHASMSSSGGWCAPTRRCASAIRSNPAR
jgi:aldehyde dehydrogenase (NAD+)